MQPRAVRQRFEIQAPDRTAPRHAEAVPKDGFRYIDRCCRRPASLVGQQTLVFLRVNGAADHNGYASQFKAAQFLRLAESKGSKTLGNSW